jgi:glycine/D-amino acid oxidase-like deaminating enzyme
MRLSAPERLRSVRFSFALREPFETPAPCWIQRDERMTEPFYAVMDGIDHYSVGLSESAPADVAEGAHIRDAHRRVTAIVNRVLPGLVPVAERVIACEYPINAQGPLAHDGWDLREHDGLLGLTGPSLFKFAPLLGRLVAERIAAR